MAGLDLVASYMTDPLWVAEYTLYLEETFCQGKPHQCVDLVRDHFPPMHAMTMEKFWDSEYLCQLQHQCQPPTDSPTLPPTGGHHLEQQHDDAALLSLFRRRLPGADLSRRAPSRSVQ